MKTVALKRENTQFDVEVDFSRFWRRSLSSFRRSVSLLVSCGSNLDSRLRTPPRRATTAWRLGVRGEFLGCLYGITPPLLMDSVPACYRPFLQNSANPWNCKSGGCFEQLLPERQMVRFTLFKTKWSFCTYV